MPTAGATGGSPPIAAVSSVIRAGKGVAAVSGDTYRVVVTREDGHWLADVPELDGAHTYARSLPALDQAVREVVVLAAGLPDEAMPGLTLDYDYHTGDPELDTTALEVRRLRREAAEPCSPPFRHRG